MKFIHWECSCGTAGNVFYEAWNFKKIVAEIVEQHSKVTPYTGRWKINLDLDIEIDEDLTEARMRHIQ